MSNKNFIMVISDSNHGEDIKSKLGKANLEYYKGIHSDGYSDAFTVVDTNADDIKAALGDTPYKMKESEEEKSETNKSQGEKLKESARAFLKPRNRRLKESEHHPNNEYADVIISNPNGEILMLERSAESDIEPNKLGFAGGKVEEGESPREAAMRELEEETGIALDEVEFIETITNDDGTKSHYFAGEVQESQEIKLDEEEHGDHTWIKETEIMETENIMFENNDRFCGLCEISGLRSSLKRWNDGGFDSTGELASSILEKVGAEKTDKTMMALATDLVEYSDEEGMLPTDAHFIEDLSATLKALSK